MNVDPSGDFAIREDEMVEISVRVRIAHGSEEAQGAAFPRSDEWEMHGSRAFSGTD